ncbi:M20/M25/M40 family metallo-hydrolase [Paramicrobacterium agarici]|uniref:Acetylornithine deacetylase/succinyl-diaminopimelate desuccinylase-like protein n=1 Tax=Paramicrobacterium agarici TaxID=630514 RepID=A0A2A9DYK9_9MICO|nr:M20/M25/M40 family metallo-hydrolase [Microbacterium agarici]PFG31401.1 acetylornithine deacetylase/succinyl-diaminopimelate desuccinylase-like protein [Microbacterium agarici]
MSTTIDGSSVPPGESADLDETAQITRDLIRIDTTNFGNGKAKGETEAAEYVEAYLADLGLTSRLFVSEPRRTSLVTRVEGRDPSKPALVVHGHLDVVPADPRTWSVDPFEGVIRDGMLWGRGAVDMKDMDAMILTSLKDILAVGQPERDLIVAFFADEENGGVLGSHHLVDNHPELFEGATEAISEVGGYSIDVSGRRAYLLQTGEKCLVWLTLRARGTASHGSRVMYDNAITKLAHAVAAVGTQEWPVRLTDTTEQLLREIARILDTDVTQTAPNDLLLATGTAAGFLQASLRTTTNPTMLDAGYKSNVIPDTAEARLDIRAMPGEESEVIAQIQDLVGPDIEVEVNHRDVGLENPFSGSLIDAVKDSLHRFDPGAPVLPYLMPAGTDNKALSKLGIAGYGFAPLRLPAEMDFPGMFHGVDERVPLDALVFGRQVLTDLLGRY